jgi:hypothetical protein
MTYCHFFAVLLNLVPVSIELTCSPFRVRAAPVCGTEVPAMMLGTYLDCSKHTLPGRYAYSDVHFGLVLVSFLIH